MAYHPCYVQTRGDDDLFHTVEDGKHEGFHDAFWHYDRLTVEQPDAVHMLVRGSHIVLRSDAVELADRPTESLL